MNLEEFKSPLPKPWLDINADTLNCRALTAQEIAVSSRVRQETVHLTPYSLWACLNNSTIAGDTALHFAMGTFVGPVAIPSGSCYNGMSVRIKVSGIWNTALGTTTTFTIRNLAGTYVHATAIAHTLIAVLNEPTAIEFDIQIAAVGAPGTGLERSIGTSSFGFNLPTRVVSSSDGATFDSTAGVEYYLYIQHADAGSSFERQLAYATVMI